jgi:hypothetical protein
MILSARLLPLLAGSLAMSILSFGLPQAARGQYSPEHPTVVGMVEKALQFLTDSARPKGMVGGEVLIGYTVLLAQPDRNHPTILRGVEEALDIIRKSVAGDKEQHTVYNVAVSVMLLASHDPQRYRRQLESARDWFIKIQRPNGGFGYLHGQYLNSGDTSQVQYVVLALWALKKADVAVPAEVVESTIRFLLSTQDPSGGWGYQGVVGRGSLVPQQQVTRSLSTAGLGALLMAADILRLFGGSSRDDDGIPEAFQRVTDQASASKEGASNLRKQDLDAALELAFGYQKDGPRQAESWYLYWRYAQERYESFREIVEGKRPVSPEWYNDAVKELAETQYAAGYWVGGGLGNHIDTAFAVLFLIRSTQRAISITSDGLVFGGYELPSDVTSIRMVGDKIVSDAEATVENLLGLMEGEENQITEGMLPRNMQLSDDPETRAAQINRLARVLRSQNPTARRLAARLLGRSEEISVAPDLIYALLDPDPHVPAIAEEGLRLISRQLTTSRVQVNPSDQQRQAAADYWKQWYLGLRPNSVFLER